jgi:hypothetical protein
MTPARPPAPPASRAGRFLPRLGVTGAFVLLLVVAILHTRQERFFYFWDNFAYHRATLESLSALEQPGASWAQHLRISMQSGFSQMFTVTLAPLMHWLGEGRLTFIGGIVGFYLLPCALLCALVVNRLCPLRRWAWVPVFVTCATLPVFWRASLTGYPDIGGLCILLLTLLLIASDLGYRHWRTALIVGPALAATFLFRRHLVYAIIPLMAVVTCSAFLHTWLHAPARFRGIVGLGLRLATSALLATAIIWAVAPNYFRELVSTNFRELYMPFTYPVAHAWSAHINYVGVLYWLAAGAGFGWTIARGGAGRWVSWMLIAYMTASLCIWVFYLRYLSVQYNLHFAIAVSVGCGLLVAQLLRAAKPAAAVALAILCATLWLERLAFFEVLPNSAERLLPVRIRPLRTPDYAAIESLIRYLREVAVAPKNNVLVISSSQVINSDMLTVGEGALFGRNRRRLAVMNGSHADTVQPYPLRDMLAADWLVLVTPFQHHLRRDDQGVVLAPYLCLTEQAPFAADWRKTDRTFELSGGIVATVFERVRSTDFATEADTARRTFATVGIKDAWTGPFMVGLAATGAEYFDVRLLTPAGPGRMTVDFEQIRFRPGQDEVRLFIRTAGHEKTIGGKLEGSLQRPVRLRATFLPDDGADQELTATHATEVVLPGGDFSFPVPSVPGLVVVHCAPIEPIAAGSPWGIAIRPLTLGNP